MNLGSRSPGRLPREREVPGTRGPRLEALEPRVLLSSVMLNAGVGSLTLLDFDGDRIELTWKGSGSAAIQLAEGAGAAIQGIALTGTGSGSRLGIRVTAAPGGDGSTTVGSLTGDRLGVLTLSGVTTGSGITLGLVDTLDIAGGAGPLQVSLAGLKKATLRLPGSARSALRDAEPVLSLTVAGNAGSIMAKSDLYGSWIAIGGRLDALKIEGRLADSTISAAQNIKQISVLGAMTDAQILAGARLITPGDLAGATFGVATIGSVTIGSAMIDSIIAAGGDPGEDGLFQAGEVIVGGRIDSLKVAGRIVGEDDSLHSNPGIYAAALKKVSIAGFDITNQIKGKGVIRLDGSAVLDPLPPPGTALTAAEIEAILERAIARAIQLGVNATIALIDREGNVLGVVRMTDPGLTADPGTSTISGGGVGGLEGFTLPSSATALSKAGTAAFLSSGGNAFSTRTAGFIIQSHFPAGIDDRPGGPLFGVQLSSLPTSDINRLPAGLAADPGGLPLYRNGQLVAGIGVELDGLYTAPSSTFTSSKSPTLEEQIALAGTIGFTAPSRIVATNIFVDGLRFPFANGKVPKLSSLGVVPDLGTLEGAGLVDVLIAPQVSPATIFTAMMLGGVVGETIGAFIDGVMVSGEQLTAADVEDILTDAHALNARLRAQIRRDSPQASQVTVAVVDIDGNPLGVFRNGDAPVFGFDVAVQKARTASFMSRPDAGVLLAAAEGGAFADYVADAAAFGVMLDGSVAMSDRTGGFLSRPFFPDGLNNRSPGPFSAQAPDVFSPFNTGLQADLIVSNLVDFVTAFNMVGDEATALVMFASGALGGGGATNVTGLQNGMQIFPGSIPLYKNGVLVGGVGVSGDGIEQDDFVAFTGGQNFQSFGPGVKRADSVVINGIRLPYVKFPRSPFAGR